MPHSKTLLLLGAIASICVVAASLYFQFGLRLEPCALCISQRILFLLIAIAFGIAWLGAQRTGVRQAALYAVMVFSVMGLYFAGRQIWLQHLPLDRMVDCGPSFELLLAHFPWSLILKTMLMGSAHCGQVTWQFLGLSMAHWCAILFVGFGVFAAMLKNSRF